MKLAINTVGMIAIGGETFVALAIGSYEEDSPIEVAACAPNEARMIADQINQWADHAEAANFASEARRKERAEAANRIAEQITGLFEAMAVDDEPGADEGRPTKMTTDEAERALLDKRREEANRKRRERYRAARDGLVTTKPRRRKVS